VYTSDRTYRLAGSATRTLIVIYDCKIVYYCDRALGTVLCAFSTRDTSVYAVFTHVCALFAAVTLDNYTLRVLDEVDKSVRTSVYANPATDTLRRINIGNAVVVDAYRLAGARSHTIAVSKAGEGAESVTGEAHISRVAGSGAGVNILFLLGATSAVTSNVSNALNNVSCLNTEYSRHALSGSVTAGYTKRRVGLLALGKSFGVRVTSRIAAGAAVSAGKAFSYGLELFVLFNRKEHGRNREKRRANNRGDEKNNDGN